MPQTAVDGSLDRRLVAALAWKIARVHRDTDCPEGDETPADRRRHADPERVAVDVLDRFSATEPELAWMELLASLRLARTVQAAVKLGVVDVLAPGAQPTADIASATGVNEQLLYRLLRALSVAGIVAEPEPGRFQLGPVGSALVSTNRPAFGREMLEFFEPELVPPDGLLRTIATGRPAFEDRHGMTFYEYLSRRSPDGGARFDAAMRVGADLRGEVLLDCADWSAAGTVVDVGGGDGTTLANLLSAHAHLRGTVFERPATAARARARLAEQGLRDRGDVVEGDFFHDSLPPGDTYILAFVLHNWDDDRCRQLLSACRRAAHSGSVLLIVEQLASPSEQASITEYFSLPSIELLPGGERTESALAGLLGAAGFAMVGCHERPGNVFSLLVARPA